MLSPRSFFVCALLAATSFIYPDLEAQDVHTTTAASAAPPQVGFTGTRVSVRGTRPGSPVVWMALVRTRVHNRVVVKIERGIVHASPGGEATIDVPAAAARRALWTIAAVEDGAAVVAAAPGYSGSQLPVNATVQAGATAVEIEAPEIHLLYVRPPAGVWGFDATDGSALDGDQEQNGTIVVPLSALERLETGPKAPPEQVRSGDVLLLLDSRRVRSTKVVVP